jgi:hypothetical protein
VGTWWQERVLLRAHCPQEFAPIPDAYTLGFPLHLPYETLRHAVILYFWLNVAPDGKVILPNVDPLVHIYLTAKFQLIRRGRSTGPPLVEASDR